MVARSYRAGELLKWLPESYEYFVSIVNPAWNSDAGISADFSVAPVTGWSAGGCEDEQAAIKATAMAGAATQATNRPTKEGRFVMRLIYPIPVELRRRRA
jgi:hypothetical protein